MDDSHHEGSQSNYEILHNFYQSIKKFSKAEENDKEEKNSSAEAKKAINELIDRAIEKIDETITNEEENHHHSLRLIAMKITMFYERSKLLMSLGDENLSRETLMTALKMINDYISEAEVIFLALRIINHYAYLLTKQDDYVTSRRILEFGETIYNEKKKKMPNIIFFTSDDLFVAEDEATAAPPSSNKLERLVTNNLQMLSFVYNKQELHEKFADYHHQVLQRQLELNDEDVTIWAIKSAKLASYFLSKNRFVEARHHLSAAIHVLYEYEKDLRAMDHSNEKIEKLQDLKRNFADVAKCWVKYGLFLFSVSKTNIVSQFYREPNQVLDKLWTIPFRQADKKNISNFESTLEDGTRVKKNTSFCEAHSFNEDDVFPDLSPTSTTKEKEPNDSKKNLSAEQPEDGPYLKFTSPSINLSEIENQVAADLVQTTNEARALFLHTHGWLKRVKMYYGLNEHPMEYVNAILDLSELYRYLAFYEEEIESQYAVQKLRADALETLSTVLREIRPQCYMSVSVELLRELAEVQLEMMGLNLRRIYAANKHVDSRESSDVILHKMDALSNMHSRLEQFRDDSHHKNIAKVTRECVSRDVETEKVAHIFV